MSSVWSGTYRGARAAYARLPGSTTPSIPTAVSESPGAAGAAAAAPVPGRTCTPPGPTPCGGKSGRAGAARFGGGDWPTSGIEWGPVGSPLPLRGDEWRLSWVGAAGVTWRVVAATTVPPAQGGKGAAVGLSAGAGRPGAGGAARSATRAALLAASRLAAVPRGAAAP